MKKILSVTLALCLLLGAVSVTAFSAEETATERIIARYNYCDANNDGVINDADAILLCDFDGDGSVTTADARLVLRIATGISAAPDGKTGDVTNDGVCGVEDARLVLRIAAGIDSIFSDSAVLDYVTNEANWVKSAKPGFTQNATSLCTSTKITTTGFPLLASFLNVTDMEYIDYIDKMKIFMSKDDYDAMKKDAEEIYVPHTSTTTVTPGSNGHYSYYPVRSYVWAMKLTDSDIKDITYSKSGNNITVTILFDDYTYLGSNYPTSYYLLQKEIYGKAFNISPYKPGSEAQIDSLTYKDGKITYTIDAATGNVLTSDYYYASVIKSTSVTTDASTGSTITMKTTINSNYTENYVINTPV